MTKMPAALATTVALTARPTPGAPPLVERPKWQLASAITTPKIDALEEAVRDVAEAEEAAREAVVEARGLDVEERLGAVGRAEERERVGVERHHEERDDDADEARQDRETRSGRSRARGARRAAR